MKSKLLELLTVSGSRGMSIDELRESLDDLGFKSRTCTQNLKSLRRNGTEMVQIGDKWVLRAALGI